MPMQHKPHLERRTGAQWRKYKAAEKARLLAQKNERAATDAQPVERATARPDEKRDVNRPTKKAAAKKPAAD